LRIRVLRKEIAARSVALLRKCEIPLSTMDWFRRSRVAVLLLLLSTVLIVDHALAAANDDGVPLMTIGLVADNHYDTF
jgi:hypothetical protein